MAIPVNAAEITYDFVAAREALEADVTLTSSGTSAGKNGMGTELTYPNELSDLFKGNFGFFFRGECTVKLTSEGLTMTGSKDTYISILNLKEGDKVTVYYTGKILFCDNPVTNIEGISAQWTDCVSETPYTLTADGNFNIQWKKTKTVISKITVETTATETVSTPGIAVTGVNGINRTVTITPGLGSFGSAVSTYYTINGEDPTNASEAYTEPITLSETATVKAVSMLADGTTSAIASLEVAAGEAIKLFANATLSDITEAGSTYVFSVTNNNLIGTPSITFSYTYGDATGEGAAYTAAGAGKLSVIASAEGYESSDALEVNVYEYEVGESLTLKDADILAEDDAAWTYNAEGTRYANWSGYNGVSKANYPYWTPNAENGQGTIGSFTFVPGENVLMRTIGFIHNGGTQNLSIVGLPENATAKFVVSTYLNNPFNVFVDATEGTATYGLGAGNTGLAVEGVQLYTKKVAAFDPAALIANPAFAATPIDNGICTYAKDVEANGTTYSGMQAVPGWNFGVENGDARAAGVFAIGGEPFLGGKGYQAPAVGPNGETAGNVLGLVAVWDATVQYVTDEVTLVPGSYKLTIPVYNSVGGTNTPQKGLFGFIANNGTEYLAAASAYTVGEWKNEVITFIIEEETTGKFSLGYDMTNVGSGSAPHLFIGGLTLEYKSILDGAIEAYNIAMNAANEAAADEIVTGVEKQALSDVIAANANIDIASVDAIIAATNALNAAVATFNAAKAAYIQLNDTKTLANTEGWPYASAEKKAVVENAKSAVAASAEDATAKAAELLKAYRQFIESNATAEGVEGAIDMTSVIVNPLSQDALNGWTLTGKANIKENEPWTDGSDVAVHKYFDSDQWGDSSWDITLAQDITLNKGKYVLSAISRGSGNVDMKLFAGEAATKLTVIGSTGGVFNRGWNDHFVTFEVTEDNTTVNIGVNGVANNAHEWMSFSNFRLACIEAAEPASPYGIIWDNGEKTQEDEYSIITLNGALFKGLKAGDIVRANFTVGANARAAQPAKIIKSGEISIFVNDIPVYEVKDIAQGTEKIEFALNEEAVAMLGMVQTLTLKYKNMVMSTIEIIEGEPAVDELLKEAEELAADAEAVAVGKLLAAIEAYKADANAEQLQAAIAQFKEDNKDQESDQTAKVATNGWMKFDGTPAGVCATQYAPAITTYDGRTAQLAEVYETTAETVGTIIYQDITGLTNGKYKVGFYGNAFYTPGRGISSTMEDGAEDVAYVFANNEKAFITAHITTETTENDFRQFDVEVTDGTIKLGMGKEQAGTNWHTMQIYQLTWFTSAKEVYANDKAAMQAAIAAAKAQAADPNKSEGKDELNTAIAAAEAALQSNMLNIAEFEAQIQALNAAVADYKKANQFIFDGVAYIIDTESGKMVAAGHDWGTRAIVNETGLDLTFTSNAETRTVTIDTQVSNGGDNHFLGSNLYTDAAAYGWILEYQGFGFYIGNGEQYLNIDANDNLVMSATPREWIIVTADGVMEERMGELAKATAENGVDATFLLKNPNFNRNDLRVSAWQVSEDCTNKNLNGGNNVNNCAESYHSTFTISQLVENAPKGLYKLTAQGYYRQDGEEAEAAPKFFIGDATAEVPAQTGTEGNMAAASESFTAGLYTIEPIEFVFNGEELTVGVTGTAANQWVVFDNFRLTYYGEQETPEPQENVFYNWYAGTEKGGTIVEQNAGETSNIGVAKRGYTTIQLSGKNDFSTNYFELTLDEPMKEGDEISVTAFRDKNGADVKRSGIIFKFEDESTINSDTMGDDYIFNNLNEEGADYDASKTEPNTLVFKVPEGANNTSKLLFARGRTQTNLFVTKLEIKHVGTVGIETVKANELLNGTIYNLNGQKMQKAQKGLYIINGKKVVVK